MSLDKKNSINNILEEKRIFPPSKKFAENSNISSQQELQSLKKQATDNPCLLYTSPSPRDKRQSRMPSSA